MNYSWKKWLHGIGSALITGFSISFTTMVVAPETFNATPEGIKKVLIVAGLSAAFSVASYLKQFPLPPDQEIVKKG